MRQFHIQSSTQLNYSIDQEVIFDTIEKLMEQHKMYLTHRSDHQLQFQQSWIIRGVALGAVIHNISFSVEHEYEKTRITARSKMWEILIVTLTVSGLVLVSTKNYSDIILPLLLIPTLLSGLKYYAIHRFLIQLTRVI